jgi:predicted TIM-barrel fold metal-dependent hydrolase
MKPRMLDLIFVLIGSTSLLAPTPAQATQFELPLFDAHVHLRIGQETDDLELLQAAGVTAGALLIGSSTAFQDLADGRIVSSHISPAFLNPTRTGYTTVRGQSASQFVQGELAAGKRVVAELALRHTHTQSAIPADDPELMEIYRVAGSFGAPVTLHYEIDDNGTTYSQEYLNQLENALSRCRSDVAAQCASTKFIWAHLGDARADIVSSMLRDHPNLYVDIAARNPFFLRGRQLSFQTLTTTTSAPFALKPEWKSLFQAFPDRVMFGMDLDDDSRWSEIQNAATADNRLVSYYNEIFREICADEPTRCRYNATARTYTLTNDATLKKLAELNAKRLLGIEAPATVEPAAVRVTLSGTTFRAGDRLTFGLTVQNPPGNPTLDLYVGAILPDGQTIVFLTASGALGPGVSLGAPASFSPLQAAMAGYDLDASSLFQFTFPASGISQGTYQVFAALVRQGAFVDGRIDSEDIVVFDSRPFMFSAAARLVGTSVSGLDGLSSGIP